MENLHGVPIVSAENVFSFLADQDIVRWDPATKPVMLEEFLDGNISDDERAEALRFAPKTEVVTLFNPKGSLYRGYRTCGKNWATTMCLLPGDLIPIIGEFKHGVNEVVLVQPSGVPSKVDEGSMERCALREFTEETGIPLSKLIPLSQSGLAVSSRNNTQKYFPFLGIADETTAWGPSKLDDTELLKLMLIPLSEWLKLISSGQVMDDCAISTTFLALQRLGRLSIS